MKSTSTVVALLGLAALAAPASADFIGQTILGPLNPGGFASASTLGKPDDNDGFDSGIHIFDIWDGGDDVYALNWLGGDMTITLTSLGGSDNDLFIYSPGSLDSTGDYGITNAVDVVTIPAAPAGIYYINVDSTFFSEGPYNLAVSVPAPGTAALFGTAVLAIARRRR